ncbi:CYTH domain-containing protein [Candidatus Falkowbacteria bacterium]|jgi:adenylate cyclase, class 2|nr:CYTH domain-containing protein [Candidatus Falkowbacteria bacterium]MBT5502970.1 CYTH domain-containing protein [Candidatus Falkowbacteria bacterium]MBT6574326.1 CYTH domain-containing protein [Candidatus Falkowbacteria bacterium]MBT7349081.1 CYTH domain-containing protein [Candidatus Falkowbacteria bacterium]MBT7500925.1 CYTH domain-containing protein [Candidatus Falkowbacteria bacterium]
MKIEFEATFADINISEVREKLKELGAKLIRPEALMRRVNFYPPIDDDTGWMRVRDEGDRITLSYKRFLGYKEGSDQMDNQQEIFLEINDFDQGVQLLEVCGARKKSYQETKREDWKYKGLEISIDTWPGLEPFVELEGSDEKTVKQVAEELGFDYSEAIFGPVGLIYEKKLGIPPQVINNETPEITFESPPQKYTK